MQFEWVFAGVAVALLFGLAVVSVAGRRARRGAVNVDFQAYKTQEIQKSGRYQKPA